MTVPAVLTLSIPSNDERLLADQMTDALTRYNGANATAESYYDGSHLAQTFGISTPPSMQSLAAVAGWPGTVVDVLEERLDWMGWSTDGDDPFGLDAVFANNALDVDSGMAHLDALIFGVSFVSVGTGFDGEPSPLITPHSPTGMTVLWDARRRRASAALSVLVENGQIVERTLYKLDETVRMSPRNGRWAVDDRDEHKLGRLPVVALANRERTSRQFGRSEITRAVRYYTDAAVRTLIGMEVNREFYSSPQRVALNVDEKAFQDAAGNPVSQWTSIQGRVWAIPPNEDGLPAPTVQQFTPASPQPFVEQVKVQAQLLAAEAGIPAVYLGFTTENPASADAIRAGESRLVKRAERRQTTFSRSWMEVGRLSLLMRDGAVPDVYDSAVSCRWRDAATPTRAAAADEVVKLTSAGIIPAESQVAMYRIGLGPAEQRQVEFDRRRSNGRATLDALRAAANGVTG